MLSFFLKWVSKQLLTLHSNYSSYNGMFGPVGGDVMVHLLSLARRQPETN